MSHEFDIPNSLRWPTPLPRDVEVVAEEHHCSRDCVHLAEAARKGFELGARAERERQDCREGTVALVAVWSFALGAMAAVTARLAVLFLAGR
jgi:hypothetical protein